jgi:hypothetical protein
MKTNDNSIKLAEKLFDVIKSKINDKTLKLLHHNYKRKYVESYMLRHFNNFKLIESKCNFERHTSDIFGDENEGLNRDGWKFTIVGNFEGSDYEITKTYTTWFKNRHKNYGTLIHEQGWNCSPYLNINNFGLEFELPIKKLITDWIDPNELPQNKLSYLKKSL